MPDHQHDPTTVTVPLKDLSVVDALIKGCQGLLVAAYEAR